MDAGDIAAWAGVGVSLLVGVMGAVAGAIGISQAKRAHESAERSNRIAEEALSEAKAANSLASEANQVSSDANAISQRALAVTADQTVYNWRIEFDRKASTVFIVNDCGNTARDVTAIIRHEDKPVVEGSVDEVPRFGKLPLTSDLFTNEILADQRNIDRANSEGGVFFAGTGKVHVKLSITWTSELGVRRSEESKRALS